jgi:Adenylate and Guanylate cyclase catalytic domain
MESTGVPGKIQVSSTTAELLKEAGKEHWLKARSDAVVAKGKGKMKTFFVDPSNRKATSSSDSETSSSANLRELAVKEMDDSTATERLIDWVVELFVVDIKKIVSFGLFPPTTAKEI